MIILLCRELDRGDRDVPAVVNCREMDVWAMSNGE